MKLPPPRQIAAFTREVWSHYREYGREMPWRSDITPYRIVVSEIMLQQTQVHRVVPKFDAWMKRFPDWDALARASTREVLQEWSGLGYNRRALYLKRIAESILSRRRNGDSFETADVRSLHTKLMRLPGIGPNTAGSILAFAFNIPCPFIETNIRSAYIHYFFPEVEKKEGRRACKKIRDDEIMPIIERALERAIASGPFKDDPRKWYWALMDYGAHIKKQMPNPSRRSAHHVRQKPFKGSNRELRSRILKAVMEGSISVEGLRAKMPDIPHVKIKTNLSDLEKEGFIVKKRSAYGIA